jgi:hypothetical protein
MQRNGQTSDFDFLQGNWRVRNRRLRQRHVGSEDWDEFPAELRMWTMLSGVMNTDEYLCPARNLNGGTVRLLDQATKLWSIYWINARSGLLFPPVTGSFSNGVGEFFGPDDDEGRPIDVRFRWSILADGNPQWEQAFSTDGGKVWETNWVMNYERAQAATV